MTRISSAVPPKPISRMGTQRWRNKSTTLARLHGCSIIPGEKRPPIGESNTYTETTIRISASRNPGVASPMKLSTVKNWSPREYLCVAE